jgi:hypothetical protein
VPAAKTGAGTVDTGLVLDAAINLMRWDKFIWRPEVADG